MSLGMSRSAALGGGTPQVGSLILSGRAAFGVVACQTRRTLSVWPFRVAKPGWAVAVVPRWPVASGSFTGIQGTSLAAVGSESGNVEYQRASGKAH